MVAQTLSKALFGNLFHSLYTYARCTVEILSKMVNSVTFRSQHCRYQWLVKIGSRRTLTTNIYVQGKLVTSLLH